MVHLALMERKEQSEQGAKLERLENLDLLDLLDLMEVQELEAPRVPPVNRELLVEMEPLGPKEKRDPRAQLVLVDDKVPWVLQGPKERKGTLDKRDDPELMADRATKVIPALLDRWVPREKVEKKEQREILAGPDKLDEEETGVLLDGRGREEQKVKREQRETKEVSDSLVVVDWRENGEKWADEESAELWESQVLRAAKAQLDSVVLPEGLEHEEPKVPQALMDYLVQREIREVQVRLANQANLEKGELQDHPDLQESLAMWDNRGTLEMMVDRAVLDRLELQAPRVPWDLVVVEELRELQAEMAP